MHADNATQEVAHNLDQADKVESLSGNVTAATEAHGGPEQHEAGPTMFGVVNGGALVSLAMLVFLIVLLVKKVPGAIGGALDKKIAAIRSQLDEAAKLRAEAEALKVEYQAKIAAAAKDAEAMRAAAEEEAADLIAEAKAEAEALVKRRQKMAEDKIAAAERAAIADVRARAATAATAAAAALIKQTHDAKADKGLIDDVIGKLTH
ncbi:F0F1 ATP synthase subunit B [Sphingobium nicotianae]|uniref:ATP synthase subunit b n=1 Tax=Sphingobium nicotianae TaxID=2782607 RepID=A0A9X1AK73_9SPHN|nr:F0F1 ATP synthase subunit B [Sphingobium nicotianae]MBT2185835.1 F0F1 ATP synthase subunit B [Sphingobium nicotianae]